MLSLVATLSPTTLLCHFLFFGENVWDRFQEFTGSKRGKCSTVDFLTYFSAFDQSASAEKKEKTDDF